MVMYEQEIEYQKQIEVLNDQKRECEKCIATYVKQIDEQRIEYERQINVLCEKLMRCDR